MLHAEALGIRRYVQVRTADNPGHAAMQARNGGSPEPFDGVPSCGSTTTRSPGADAESAKAGQELLEDEQNFIDLASSPIWFAEEWQVV